MSEINEVDEIMLTRIRLGMAQYVSRYMLESMKYEVINDVIYERFTHYLRAYVLGNKVHEYSYEDEDRFTKVPHSWWDSFKVTKFPKWLLNKYPPQLDDIPIHVTVTHSYTKVCPHIDIPYTMGSKVHFDFLKSFNEDEFKTKEVKK